MKSTRRDLICAVVAGCLALTVPASAASTAAPAAAPAAAAPAAGAGPTSIGTFKSWTAWKGNDANGLICYISAAPTSSKPDGAKRDPVHFLVINRKAGGPKGQGSKDEVQTLIGYTFKKDGKPTATIDSKSYNMVVDGSAAWLAAVGDEPGFVAALKSGTNLIVK